MALTIHKTPFSTPYKDINIVNNNYNHYGNSVLPNYSKSILSEHPSNYSQSNSYHSLNSRRYHNSNHSGNNNNNNVGRSNNNDQGNVLSAQQSNSSLASNNSDIVELDSSNFSQIINKKTKFNYKSLIPDNKVKRFLNRLDADSFSIFSMRSSHTAVPYATIKDLPLEIMKEIISNVNHYKTNVNCLYVNKQFNKATKFIIYNEPFLTSSYRVAQLITTLRQSPEIGEMVKKLDLSNLQPGTVQQIESSENDGLDNMDENSDQSDNEDLHLEYAHASWRDWKYRGDPLYGSSILNSYNLSKSKSSTSVNSISTMNSIKLKFIKQFKSNDYFPDDLNSKFKKFSKKIWKFRKKTSTTSSNRNNNLKRKIEEEDNTIELNKSNSIKQVKIHFQNPKNQPFSEGHPYTNKFLLKYSNSKDLPIGYILYFLDLCPNLTYLNLSKISLSTDFQIIYQTPQFKTNSLVEDVLSLAANDSDHGELLPLYLSDSNVYFNIKTFQNQFVKLYESAIMLKLCNLSKLQTLELSSISWLNFKILRQFTINSKSLQNDSLQKINLLNSGMIRNLNWANNYTEIQDFKDYFQSDQEPIVRNDELNIMRNVGMNY